MTNFCEDNCQNKNDIETEYPSSVRKMKSLQSNMDFHIVLVSQNNSFSICS